MYELVSGSSGWTQYAVPDAADTLYRLSAGSANLRGEDFAALLQLLQSSRLSRLQLSQHLKAGRASALQPLFERLLSNPDAERAIEAVIDSEGQVRDAASARLRELRQALRFAEAKLVELLEGILGALPAQYRAPDLSVTLRNGRWVIPVRREGKGFVGGIVHGVSASGATLFVEPPAAIEACNRIRELEGEEAREVERILRELAERLQPLAEPLAEALDALAELDSLYARARFAIEFQCAPVGVIAPPAIRLLGARHPLLVAQGGEVVPFDLELDDDQRTLVVSGPNTGGKTVLLKTAGLAVLLMQAGVPFPLGAGSRLPVMSKVFADIGDDQSIAENLSTFSAHLRNIGAILREAETGSLVLLDELGAGTDPAEGTALGGAILEELTRRGALTIATTHLGGLKRLAGAVPGVVNGSLQFDSRTMLPTYRFIKGLPGRSYGITMAQRLGISSTVVERALELLPREERELFALLEQLEARERTLAEREREVLRQAEELRSLATSLEERQRALQARERALRQEVHSQIHKELLEARREIARISAAVRHSVGEERERQVRAAQRQLEGHLLAEAELLERLAQADEAGPESSGENFDVRPGTEVAVSLLGGRRGKVMECRGQHYVVAVGGMKLSLRKEQLRPVAQLGQPTQATVPVRLPAEDALSEIDVRGLRSEELAPVVERALDAAIRADLPQLRIIHGKGTGALRTRLAEILRGDPRVSSFRIAPWNEGGAGVTVVTL
jgi:DNA mismatch repair protein MutS2